MGGAGIHSADILHGSRENRSSAARIGLGINVRTGRSRPRPGAQDYGFTSWLDHPFVAPVLYPRPPGVEPPRPEALEVPPRGSVPPPRRAVVPVAFVPPSTMAREGALVLPHLGSGMHVLDAGCASGALTTGLAYLVAPGSVTAVDVDPEQVTAARAVRELSRVCKPGGMIVVRESVEMFEGLPAVHVAGRALPFAELWREIRRSCGGDLLIAPRLKGLLVAAGFGDVTSHLTSELSSEPPSIARLAASLQVALGGRLGDRAVTARVISRASLDDVLGQMARWPCDAAASGAVSWIEHLARTSPALSG